MRYKFSKIPSDFEFLIKETPFHLSDEDTNLVNQLWEQGTNIEGVILYNNLLFNIQSVSPHKIEGCFVEYKYFYAQRSEPKKFSHFKITPLAITGLILKNGNVLIGKRSAHVHQNKGIWELAPAGGIDDKANILKGKICPKKAISQEFHEEIGLSIDAYENEINLKLLVEDPADNVVDIIAQIEIPFDTDKILDAFSKNTNTEYSEIRFVPIELLLSPQSTFNLDALSRESLLYFSNSN